MYVNMAGSGPDKGQTHRRRHTTDYLQVQGAHFTCEQLGVCCLRL